MDHIVTAFEQDLRDISSRIAAMGDRAGGELEGALAAMLKGDSALADRVIAEDSLLDLDEAEVERRSIRIIALRQPVADDLRRPIAAMKIAANLERVGDLAKNIAKRSRLVGPGARGDAFPVEGLEALGKLVRERLGVVVRAYVTRDLEAAVEVWARDAEIDAAHDRFSRDLLAAITSTGEGVETGMHLLFVAKNLERIGDHATNIAELIHYEIAGAEIEGARPKADSLQ
jgi:phosphate transport system protein